MRYLKKPSVTTEGDKGSGINFGASPTPHNINYTPKICNFCFGDDLQFVHGHYHCTNCGLPNMECCSGERNEQ